MPATKRPHPEEEFRRIKGHYPLLSSTGCTRAFCQSGRMTHTDEPRVGHEQAVPETVEQDAIDFLQQLRRDGVIETDAILQGRMLAALKEIRSTSVTASPTNKVSSESIPGIWYQTPEELQHGIRLAWKHSRKCIMRSEYSYLKLRDMRHVKTSKEMGQAILAELHQAFNGGDIQPSVVVFRPKRPNSPGPMVWNQQLLSFAGYRQPDKTILGDPANAAITSAIMALGWEPPAVRTRWDLLPLVTMMDGDEPYITPIPQDWFPLVAIHHPAPEQSLAFERLGLRWVPAPALSQMGFDIGGVQYTGTPFMGWFMDAEIGVRNLADSFRYNVLPDVVSALKLLPPDQDLDELPQNQRLALLSRAQSELNYAVNWSFNNASVRISDSLTASAMYTNFDDNHLATHGFRLPADPYWIAPPQGSIVPIWHRGGAPNYQPKPMICRLQEAPHKVWARLQAGKCPVSAAAQTTERRCPMDIDAKSEDATPTIRTYYCSSGTTAQRLASKLEQKLHAIVDEVRDDFVIAKSEPFNNFNVEALHVQDIVFVIASSSGYGDVPVNGQSAVRKLKYMDKLESNRASFYVFGNGNSSYGENYNGAAQKIQAALENIDLVPAAPMFEADTLKEDPPWRQFNTWLNVFKEKFGSVWDDSSNSEEEEPDDDAFELLVNQLSRAEVISVDAPSESGMKLVALDVGELKYGPLSHIDVFVPLERKEVDSLLWTTRFSGDEEFAYGDCSVSTRRLFSLADPAAPFRSLQWMRKLQLELPGERAEQLGASLMADALKALPFGWQARAKAKAGGFLHFFSALPITRTRTFSAASAQAYWDLLSAGGGGVLELLVQTHTGGHFTERFLSGAGKGDHVYVRVRRGPGEHLIDADRPLIAFATGSGIAPLRGILQGKCARIFEQQAKGADADEGAVASIRSSPVSLFLGYHPKDEDMVTESVREAQALGIVDMLHLTPSNPQKDRAQDKMFVPGVSDQLRDKIQNQGADVFICASQAPADDFARNLEAIVGVPSIRDALGERWVEEVYVYKET